MFTLPNILSLLRIPLAILFIYDNVMTRVLSISLAAMTDFFDGYLARRFQQTSRYGVVLDPMSDKFFVIVSLSLFYMKEQISLLEACTMLCRDFSVIIFGIYLLFTGNFYKYHFRSIWCGKVTTSLQLSVLMALTLNLSIPPYLYGFFIVLGFLALIELYFSDHSFIPNENK